MKEECVVFGCGETADKYFDKITEKFDVVAFVDNNSALWGNKKNGIVVISPEQIPEDTTIVVASGYYYHEMLHQLGRSRQSIYVVLNEQLARYMPSDDQLRLDFEYPNIEPIPTILQVGISSFCNIRCRYCPFHSEHTSYFGEKGLMSAEVVNEICRQIEAVDTLISLHLVGDGEPFTNPNWNEIVEKMLKAQPSIKELIIYTNGMLLNKENVLKLGKISGVSKVLEISIDGISPKDSEYWRKGSDFSKIYESINYAYANSDKGNTRFVIPSCVVLPKEVDSEDAEIVERYLREFSQWLKQAFPFATIAAHLAAPYTVGEIPGTAQKFINVFPRLTSCDNLFRLLTISQNGDIISCPCGYVGTNQQVAVIGNILKDDLLRVWNESATINDMRQSFLSGEKPKVCKQCFFLGGDKYYGLQRTESEGFYK